MFFCIRIQKNIQNPTVEFESKKPFKIQLTFKIQWFFEFESKIPVKIQRYIIWYGMDSRAGQHLGQQGVADAHGGALSSYGVLSTHCKLITIHCTVASSDLWH